MWSATEGALKPLLVETRMPCSLSAGRSSQSVSRCPTCAGTGDRGVPRPPGGRSEPGDPATADHLGAPGTAPRTPRRSGSGRRRAGPRRRRNGPPPMPRRGRRRLRSTSCEMPSERSSVHCPRESNEGCPWVQTGDGPHPSPQSPGPRGPEGEGVRNGSRDCGEVRRRASARAVPAPRPAPRGAFRRCSGPRSPRPRRPPPPAPGRPGLTGGVQAVGGLRVLLVGEHGAGLQHDRPRARPASLYQRIWLLGALPVAAGQDRAIAEAGCPRDGGLCDPADQNGDSGRWPASGRPSSEGYRAGP